MKGWNLSLRMVSTARIVEKYRSSRLPLPLVSSVEGDYVLRLEEALGHIHILPEALEHVQGHKMSLWYR